MADGPLTVAAMLESSSGHSGEIEIYDQKRLSEK
jgi:hypothetical protein